MVSDNQEVNMKKSADYVDGAIHIIAGKCRLLSQPESPGVGDA
jgi:hypothetical protein